MPDDKSKKANPSIPEGISADALAEALFKKYSLDEVVGSLVRNGAIDRVELLNALLKKGPSKILKSDLLALIKTLTREEVEKRRYLFEKFLTAEEAAALTRTTSRHLKRSCEEQPKSKKGKNRLKALPRNSNQERMLFDREDVLEFRRKNKSKKDADQAIPTELLLAVSEIFDELTRELRK